MKKFLISEDRLHEIYYYVRMGAGELSEIMSWFCEMENNNQETEADHRRCDTDNLTT